MAERPLSMGCTESWSGCLGWGVVLAAVAVIRRGVVSGRGVAVAAGRGWIGQIRLSEGVARVGEVVGQGLLDGAQLVADAGEEGQVASGLAAGAGSAPVGAPGVLALAFGH